MFKNAMSVGNARTENGMPTNLGSGSRVLDLFFKQGAMRANPKNVVQLFDWAIQEDALMAMKSMFYNRDVRGGQGERATFRAMFQWLCENYPDLAIKNLKLVPEYGMWKDLYVARGTPVWGNVLEELHFALFYQKNSLCAKYMPREGKKDFATVGMDFITKYRLSKKSYRKMLVKLTNVVETAMCSGDWEGIKYEHVPSVAQNKYRRAFLKHDADRYNKYIQAVVKGETKINAATLFPSDLVHKVLDTLRAGLYRYSYMKDSIKKSERDAIQAQWMNLPDYMPKGKRILPVCDLSGSMSGQPMEVSMALGIYLSERNVGPYQNCFITFSRTPSFVELSGDLVSRVGQMAQINMAENTDLEAVFEMVLTRAIKNRLPESEMPESILIISDMQFDYSVGRPSDTAIDMIRRKYVAAGYKIPSVVFWNVRDSVGVPVKVNEMGVALVSGYSPSIMVNILNGEMNPLAVMNRTLNTERYSAVRI